MFSLGDGRDQILDTGGDLDIISLGEDILTDDIEVTQFRNTTVLSFNSGKDRITFNTDGIEEVHFADGTVWTADDIAALV
ncbi:MAG: hypothetical protein LBF61_09340 [Azoarcus sp.]|nr:hypothetical protein [Azoarcus sp.]